nr:uncharacterized protein LOC105463556 [Macaca nemestrina]
MLQVTGKSISFLMDMGATYSVLPSFSGPSHPSTVTVMRIDGTPSTYHQTPPLSCRLDGSLFLHSFLIIPSCPVPLLGRDLLSKLRASVHFQPNPSPHLAFLFPLLSPDKPCQADPPLLFPVPINPKVWDTSTPITAQHHTPVRIRLKDPSKFPSRPQFPISLEHRQGLKPIITHLLRQHILVPANSPCNTPILPVWKSSGAYHLIQDLCFINEALVPTFPVVPNPYTLLSSIPPDTTHFTVLDLKDAFFTIPLHPDCHFLFAFTWEDPDTHVSSQLTWTVLPQRFRDSSHFFRQALAWDILLCPQPIAPFYNM